MFLSIIVHLVKDELHLVDKVVDVVCIMELDTTLTLKIFGLVLDIKHG